MPRAQRRVLWDWGDAAEEVVYLMGGNAILGLKFLTGNRFEQVKKIRDSLCLK